MAENLIGSEIIKMAGIIREKQANGAEIFNFTIGDFDPNIYPIPSALKERIQAAYEQNKTNYPPAAGLSSLLASVRNFILHQQGLDYPQDAFLISGGARPLIYALYQTLLDPGDSVIYPLPSWNNNHYCHLSRARAIEINTHPEGNFMPSASDLDSYLSEARMLALCSPLNPTGTCFTEEGLKAICSKVLAENERRKRMNQKPLYLLYDQIYHTLVYGATKHVDPVSLIPELRTYTIYIDGLSKAFAATGVRVGWAFGPSEVIAKMRAILSHVGAWAPNPEQFACASYLNEPEIYQLWLSNFKARLEEVLEIFYAGFKSLSERGFNVDAIAPQAGLYLTVKFDLIGKKSGDKTIRSQNEVWEYLLEAAKMAIVPFSAFGTEPESSWYRLSIGTCTPEIARKALRSLEIALTALED
jgi:aspartate aminotransferase